MASDPELFLGLISGTSMDSLDVALAAIDETRFVLRATRAVELDTDLREAMLALCEPGSDELQRLSQADVRFADFCGQAALDALQAWGVDAAGVRAIGSHGQTVRHAPRAQPPYSVQLGNPSVLAERTGITTVADFRARDIAAGGEGAPLVPAFHEALFRNPNRNRVVLNIGGMANVTLLPADSSNPVTGFDTGPGNVLIDLWSRRERGEPYDRNGEFARTGSLSKELFSAFEADEYFSLPAPKSTGRERFNMDWMLRRAPDIARLAPADVANTLTELTASTISDAISSSELRDPEILVCGGGHHNAFLMERLASHVHPSTVTTTTLQGIDGDFVEACAFAWLAWRTLNHAPGNLPPVTGARGKRILGGIYPA